MTVSTTSNSGALTYPLKNLFGRAGETALAFLVMLAIPKRRRAWRRIVCLIAIAFAISGIAACGGGGSSGGGGTTKGNYSFTVTGTAAGSGSSTTASTTVQVMVN
jgi:trimeric autotransporter adhesin